MRLTFYNGQVEEFTVVLVKRGFDRIGQLTNIADFSYKANLNSADEISFTSYKIMDGVNDPLWDEIYDLRLIWIKELNQYFQIEVSLSETITPSKDVTGKALCESELSQIILRNIEINSDDDIARDEYDANFPTVFYRNPDDYNSDAYNAIWNTKKSKYTVYQKTASGKYKRDADGNKIPDNAKTISYRKSILEKSSLLHRILDKAPHYNLNPNKIDESLWDIQRTFSINGTSIYDFMIGDCSEQFNCLFTFDSTSRTIGARDLYSTCPSCGYRGDFTDICPKCGNRNDIKYFGEDTTILVDVENLTDEITYSADVGQIKNCFYLEAGDDDMTAAIKQVNPNGSQYIYYFPQETLNDMSDELVAKLTSYQEMCQEKEPESTRLTKKLYNAWDDYYYYKTSMMPTSDRTGVITPATEVDKLEAGLNNTTVSVVDVSKTSKTAVENAIKNYAKIFINTGFVKLSFVSSSYSSSNHKWTGEIKLESFSDSKNTATTDKLTVTIDDDYERFINQKVLKKLQQADDNGYIFDVIGQIGDSTDAQFKESLTYYSYDMLKSFYDAIGAARTVLQQLKNDELDEFKTLYKNRQKYVKDEMKVRNKEVEDKYDIITETQAKIDEIHEYLDFYKHLGDDLYDEFVAYTREDSYGNSNYISDGLTNAQVVKRANAFIEEAQREIVKSGEYQYSISSNLKNLLLIPEFENFIYMFELGNWIRFRVGKDIFRLRLISYSINFSDVQTINTEFSTLTKTADGLSDVKSVLSQAATMATTYSHTQQQAEKGEKTSKSYSKMVKNGINSAHTRIMNNNNEEVIIDEKGITLRTWDDIEEDYDGEQLRLTHNVLCYTEDGWDSSVLGLGKMDFKVYGLEKTDTGEEVMGYHPVTTYGLIAKGINAGFITGSKISGNTIIGGKIYSKNYEKKYVPSLDGEDGTWVQKGTFIDLENGEFNIWDSLVFEGKELSVTGKITADKGTIGGWQIGPRKIRGGDATTGTASFAVPSDVTDFVLTIGGTDHSNYNNSAFYVQKDGSMYVGEQAGNFKGTGWYFKNNVIYSNTDGGSSWGTVLLAGKKYGSTRDLVFSIHPMNPTTNIFQEDGSLNEEPFTNNVCFYIKKNAYTHIPKGDINGLYLGQYYPSLMTDFEEHNTDYSYRFRIGKNRTDSDSVFAVDRLDNKTLYYSEIFAVSDEGFVHCGNGLDVVSNLNVYDNDSTTNKTNGMQINPNGVLYGSNRYYMVIREYDAVAEKYAYYGLPRDNWQFMYYE